MGSGSKDAVANMDLSDLLYFSVYPVPLAQLSTLIPTTVIVRECTGNLFVIPHRRRTG